MDILLRIFNRRKKKKRLFNFIRNPSANSSLSPNFPPWPLCGSTANSSTCALKIVKIWHGMRTLSRMEFNMAMKLSSFSNAIISRAKAYSTEYWRSTRTV
jgi:hypothetical protein